MAFQVILDPSEARLFHLKNSLMVFMSTKASDKMLLCLKSIVHLILFYLQGLTL